MQDVQDVQNELVTRMRHDAMKYSHKRRVPVAFGTNQVSSPLACVTLHNRVNIGSCSPGPPSRLALRCNPYCTDASAGQQMDVQKCGDRPPTGFAVPARDMKSYTVSDERTPRLPGDHIECTLSWFDDLLGVLYQGCAAPQNIDSETEYSCIVTARCNPREAFRTRGPPFESSGTNHLSPWESKDFSRNVTESHSDSSSCESTGCSQRSEEKLQHEGSRLKGVSRSGSELSLADTHRCVVW